MTELKPCSYCGMRGKTETFGKGVTLWACSHNKLLGGKCPDQNAYFTADAWNEAHTRAAPRTDGDDGELVERLLNIAHHSKCTYLPGYVEEPVRQAADRITALSAEVERLTEAYNRLGDTALAEVAKWATESGRKDAKIDALMADLQTLRRQALGAKP